MKILKLKVTTKSKMKMFVILVLVGSLALIQCEYLDCLSGGKPLLHLPLSNVTQTNQALVDLVQDGKAFLGKLKLRNSCERDMHDISTGVSENILRYDLLDAKKTCYVVIDQGGELLVISKTGYENQAFIPPGSDLLAQRLELQAAFLPQRPDKNTYMILNPKIAPWFFTTHLSGCDVFLATNPNKPKNPLVIHSNKNSCQAKPENLRRKGEDIDHLMASHPNYHLLIRVISAPGQRDKKQVNNYLAQYQRNHGGIEVLQYQTTSQFFYFIGHFIEGSWKFLVKGETNGNVIWRRNI